MAVGRVYIISCWLLGIILLQFLSTGCWQFVLFCFLVVFCCCWSVVSADLLGSQWMWLWSVVNHVLPRPGWSMFYVCVCVFFLGFFFCSLLVSGARGKRCMSVVVAVSVIRGQRCTCECGHLLYNSLSYRVYVGMGMCMYLCVCICN